MWWPFKNKFNKLTREEVVEAVIDLEKQLEKLENGIVEKQNKIDELMERGKTEPQKDTKIFIAKKINFLKDEKQQDINRCMYIMYNIKLLNKLKNAIDDNQFFQTSRDCTLNSLLKDQKGLAKFLNKSLNTRVEAENILTSSDEMFQEIMATYEPNETIYGINSDDDGVLAIFETSASIAEDNVFSSEESMEAGGSGEESV